MNNQTEPYLAASEIARHLRGRFTQFHFRAQYVPCDCGNATCRGVIAIEIMNEVRTRAMTISINISDGIPPVNKIADAMNSLVIHLWDE